jgi:hypothetical protein
MPIEVNGLCGDRTRDLPLEKYGHRKIINVLRLIKYKIKESNGKI